jgi:hypothetical protein
MSDPAITIDLIALADRETGAPDPDPNRDTAFDESEPNLPGAWAMSIRELDSWHAYYRTRERGLGLGCGALTGAEQAHRADILRNIALRHEARRHSSFS